MHPDLAKLLRRRLKVIADHAWRDRDPQGHLDALRKASEALDAWYKRNRTKVPAQLGHFLGACSYQKALEFLELADAEADSNENVTGRLRPRCGGP